MFFRDPAGDAVVVWYMLVEMLDGGESLRVVKSREGERLGVDRNCVACTTGLGSRFMKAGWKEA